MKRREFIAATAALAVSSRQLLAQQPRRFIGFLAVNELMPTWQSAWLGGLRNHGWVDGNNLTIEYRYGRSQDRLPALAAELVALGPEVIVGANTASTAALKSATSSIPIVFVGTADAVGIGFVQSLSRPGGNLTGVATFVPGHFISKQVQLMRELVPNATRIVILSNPGNPVHRKVIAEELPQTARQLGVTFPVVEATVAEEFDAAFATAAAQHAEAIVVFADFTTLRNAKRITALAAKHQMPAIYLGRNYVTDGGLISYGPDFPDLYLRAGAYVDKILKGARPSDLPIDQPTKFELVINLKVAKELGLTVPPSLLATADEVYE
jgi:putative ABC transport system substrate-binding protein